MPSPLYTITIPEGATLAYLFRVLLVGRTAAETVDILFKQYMRGQFRARGLTPNCRFLEENGALVVEAPDGQRFDPATIKVFARGAFDPPYPTFEEEEAFIPNYLGPTPEEQVELEERAALGAWEWEREQEEREARERAVREAQDREAQELEARKAQEIQDRAARESQEREEQEREAQELIAQEAQERAVRQEREARRLEAQAAQERAAREEQEAQEAQERLEREAWEAHFSRAIQEREARERACETQENEGRGPIIDAPASESDDSATPPTENDDSEASEPPSNLPPLTAQRRKRGTKPSPTWRNLMPHLESKFADGIPPLDDARAESNNWLKDTGITMTVNGLKAGLKWRLPYLHKNIQDWITVDGLPNIWKD